MLEKALCLWAWWLKIFLQRYWLLFFFLRWSLSALTKSLCGIYRVSSSFYPHLTWWVLGWRVLGMAGSCTHMQFPFCGSHWVAISPSWCYKWNVPRKYPEFWMLQETLTWGFEKLFSEWGKGNPAHRYGNQQVELLERRHTALNIDKQCRLQRKCLKESSVLLNMYWIHTVNRCWGLGIQTPG